MKVLIYEIQQSKPEITKNDMKSLLKNFRMGGRLALDQEQLEYPG